MNTVRLYLLPTLCGNCGFIAQSVDVLIVVGHSRFGTVYMLCKDPQVPSSRYIFGKSSNTNSQIHDF